MGRDNADQWVVDSMQIATVRQKLTYSNRLIGLTSASTITTCGHRTRNKLLACEVGVKHTMFSRNILAGLALFFSGCATLTPIPNRIYRWVSTVFYGVRAASLQQAFINQPLERSTDLKNAYMIGITVNVLTDPQK